MEHPQSGFSESTCMVIDYGSSCLKIGMAMMDSPDLKIPTYTSETSFNSHAMILDASPSDSYVAEDQDENSSKSPRSVLRGKVINWDSYESILSRCLHYQGLCDGSELSPVLIAEHPLTSKSQREKIAEILFEKFHSPALSFANSAVLSTIASGRTSGLAVECGSGVSFVTPVFEGYALDHATQRLELAGQDITENCWKMLHPFADPRCDFSTSQRFKESCVTATATAPLLISRDCSMVNDTINFSLPDGQIVTVARSFAVQTCGSLFGKQFQVRPISSPSRSMHSSSLSSSGLQHCVSSSISSCDASIHPCLINNIILSGGTTMMPGFGECLKQETVQELRKTATDKSVAGSPLASPAGRRRRASSVHTSIGDESELYSNRINIKLLDHVRLIPETGGKERGYNSQRRYGAWIGGSIMASLDTFTNIRVSRNDWEDIGRESVSRKKI